MPEITVERMSYGGWANCYRLSNGDIELVATADVGPRIIRFGFVNGRNLFAEFPDQLGKSGEPHWMPRGGHRLWAAPELIPDTYAVDNQPVKATVGANALTLLQPRENETGLQKEVSIELTGNGDVTVTHRIHNCAAAARQLAPWALTQMAVGGVGISAFPPRGRHHQYLTPTHPVVMWAYTNFSDPRWTFTEKYLILRQDANDSSPQKSGLFNANTCAVYLLGSDLFAKRVTAVPHAQYPDFGCSVEMFTNADFLELETLGPLVSLAPDTSVTHVEHWSLQRDVHLPALTDTEIDHVLASVRT